MPPPPTHRRIARQQQILDLLAIADDYLADKEREFARSYVEEITIQFLEAIGESTYAAAVAALREKYWLPGLIQGDTTAAADGHGRIQHTGRRTHLEVIG